MVEAEDWGKVLGKMIGRTEARVASYKKLVGEAYRANDRDLVDFFKSCQKDEEKFLKRLRKEKTYWNEGVWGWILMDRRHEEDEDAGRADRG